MMTRNTEKRVEVACPIYDESIKKRLVRNLNTMLADNVKARVMQSDGTYKKKAVGEKKICSQEVFMKEALNAKRPERIEEKEPFFARLRRVFYQK